MNDYAKYGIVIPAGKVSGQIYTICPKCSNDRKKSKIKCLGVNLDLRVFHCSHCNYKGALPKEQIQQVPYKKPVWTNITTLSDKVVKWFATRKISQQTLIKLKITEGEEYMPQVLKKMSVVNFNYFRDEELVNIKYRDGQKNFMLFKGAELIFYNVNAILNQTEIFIVEGEMDVCALVESGIENVISVPNGANLNTNNLSYIDNCIHLFNDIIKIHIATDNDQAGRKLREDIADRFGKERCDYVEFKECKDANDYLIKYGVISITDISFKEFPLEGVFTISDISDEIDDMYDNGIETGDKIGISNFDILASFVKGYVSIITGIPSHGKSDFVDFITLRLKLIHGWKISFYSPENRPTKLHFSKMARKLTGKNWFGVGRLTREEMIQCKEYLNNQFWFIKPERDFSLETILDSVLMLKLRYGIDAFVIDAWNKLEHKYNISETQYIGESLDLISNFCEVNNVHCFLIAHPTKQPKDKVTMLYEVPTLYSIAGSANFYNKADIGICVYRNKTAEDKTTDIHVQKVKFNHWGEEGLATLNYDINSGRYYEHIFDNKNWIDNIPVIETSETPYDAIPVAPNPNARIEPVKYVPPPF